MPDGLTCFYFVLCLQAVVVVLQRLCTYTVCKNECDTALKRISPCAPSHAITATQKASKNSFVCQQSLSVLIFSSDCTCNAI